MIKEYICGWEPDKAPNDNRHVYTFSPRAEDAYHWEYRYLAEVFCVDLNRGVRVPSDGTYLCTDFQIEEHAPGRFLIYCKAPFGA